MARRALLCGINDYKSVRNLRGCVRDVEDMRSLLITAYGFRDEDIRVLRDQEVVKSRLKREWKWLMGGGAELLVFHFSGHGSFLPDKDGDEDDRSDEIFCLHDMDFGKPGTYLLDDDFATWIGEKPAGVDLIVITDCCHSGTSTRIVLDEIDGRAVMSAVDPRATALLADPSRTGGSPAEVLVRFLPPPNYLPGREASMRRAVRAARDPMPPDCFHLAACQDNETAADAPIGGAYHGAFTHHLCRLLSSEPRLDSAELITRLITTLTTPPFMQRPAANGKPRPGPLFGAAPAATTSPVPDREDASLRGELRELVSTLRDFTAILRGTVGAPIRQREAERRLLVYVHGIDEHPDDFSSEWWESVKPHLGNLFGAGVLGDTRFNVHWSDIVNPRALPERLPPEAELARRMIERELQERSARYADPGRAVAARTAFAGVETRGRGPQLDDFLRYMFQSGVRTAVLARFTQTVRPLLAAGHALDIVAHSWGSVVAYEGLLELEAEGLPGRVANLFTVGAALSIGLVRWQLDLGGRRPSQVRRWTNVDAKGDSIGGGIGAVFPVHHEYLELDPTGCTRGWFGYELSCAHASYFRTNNIQVNRDIFARHMVEG